MRAVVVGAVEFTRVCVEALVGTGVEVVVVLTLAPERAGFHGDYVDLAPVAERLGVPLRRVADVNDGDVVASMRALAPDVVFVLGWSRLVGPDVLALAPLGCIGAHPALLPADRGRHPITWALVDGRDESGLSFLWLDEGADSGDILWQRPFPIAPDDDVADVYARISELAREAICEFVPQLEAGTAPRVQQDESRATYRRKRTEDDRVLRWERPTVELHNLVRALARPYIGAVTHARGDELIVWRARPAGAAGAAAPGTVVRSRPPAVRTADGALELLEYEPELPLRVGEVLGEAS